MSHPATTPPDESEYAPPFARYIRLVPTGDVRLFLERQLAEMLGLLRGVGEAGSLVRHPPYTWSIKQVVGHITDCERVFGHRALWIGRGNATPLASFDENEFMRAAEFDGVAFAELLAEFEAVRQGHLLFLKHLAAEAWLRHGTVNDHPATPRAFAYSIAGHTQHHLEVLKKRLSPQRFV